MLLAVIEDRFGFLLVHQIESEMGGNVTKSKRQQRLRFKTVVHSLGIGVDDVVRQCRLRDPIRLTTHQLPPPELETDQGSQMEQVGVVDPLTDQLAERFGSSGIGYRQCDFLEPSGDSTWDRAAHPSHTVLAQLLNPPGFSDLAEQVAQLVTIKSSDLCNAVDVPD